MESRPFRLRCAKATSFLVQEPVIQSCGKGQPLMGAELYPDEAIHAGDKQPPCAIAES